MVILSIGQVIFFVILFILTCFVVFFIVLCNKYKQFIINNSISLIELKKLNSKYEFKKVEFIKFTESFDNEVYYEKLSPKDLLTYDLVKHKQSVKKNISAVYHNINYYDLYLNDLKHIIKFGEFLTINVPKFTWLLNNIERRLFNKIVLNPTVTYFVNVSIVLTNINGEQKKIKYANFNIEEIEEVISKLEDKYNDRYQDRDTWDAICRIERAKVTNKMRFAIYNRDRYRCCKCGRSGVFNDLEIDHIMPIAKGGKTHPDNLQTLCKRCNREKSDTIEAGTTLYNDTVKKTCPECGAPLKIVNGKNGKFYGCMNYPKCKYTEKYKK